MNAAIVQQLEKCSIRHPCLFYGILEFLVEVGSNEVEGGGLEVFTRWKGQATTQFKQQLKDELLIYVQGCFPFDLPFDRECSTARLIEWWRSCLNERTCILLHLANKLFSICVNSMPEECMGSTFTWMTPAVWSRLTVEMMASKAQIHQFYRSEEAVQYNQKSKAKTKQTKFCTIKNSFYRKDKKTSKKASHEMAAEDHDDSWLDEEEVKKVPCNPASLLLAAKFVNSNVLEIVSALSDNDLTEQKVVPEVSTEIWEEGDDTDYSLDDLTFH
ncbi:hypothetical protein K435DRAFT_860272 [Dendrothele bispora CBS 962.96]|uniref:HAT C-terminal dimerisation domain-containing protein n=1 Tax=Dendrothele bispora (strain CBS 962.96) TaxID=1314807 RepID=A0A4S8LZ04_DENBC|nr:hypothetical protein K435DRAFT_860272 [Dendrothele bispora CBS 962.96]